MAANLFANDYISTRLREMEAAQHLSKAGGIGRAKALSPKRRKEIASKAARTRWDNNLQANACYDTDTRQVMLAKR